MPWSVPNQVPRLSEIDTNIELTSLAEPLKIDHGHVEP